VELFRRSIVPLSGKELKDVCLFGIYCPRATSCFRSEEFLLDQVFWYVKEWYIGRLLHKTSENASRVLRYVEE
jgi:hypothetical protein